MSPPVSVITTVYNGEDYIDQSKECILNQDYEDLEWIIVDDGSTDDSVQLLREVESEDDRVTVFTPGRLGRARALNFAVEQATGDIIVNHDIDDVSYKNRIQEQVNFLSENPDVGVVGCHYILVDDIRNERYVRQPPTDHPDIIRALARYIPLAHTLATFRKSAWKEAGKYPDIENLIDMGLWIQIANEDWKFANIPEVLGEHLVHNESFWNDKYSYIEQQWDMIQMNIQAIRTLNLPMKMYIYPIGRIFYPLMPTRLKKYVRRTIGGSDESDVS